MAIKINELQVNVHFENQDGANAPSKSTEQLSDYTPSMNNDNVVQKAVKEVLRILNERNER